MSRYALKGNEDPMGALCKMVVQTGYEDLPDEVVAYAKHSILDTMAVIIGGSAMEGVPVVVNLVKDKGGKPQSFIPFYGGKVPASEAAFAIGPMARAMDMGDAHGEGGHCSEYTIPALLAATGLKNHVSGKEFITSFVVGQEVLVRIGIAYKLVSKGIPSGYHGGHYIFGSIASVGKLIGLGLDELLNAQGIGRGMTQPHDTAMYQPASLMVRVHHGFVCQDAINACLLAKGGITGPRADTADILAGVKGYLTTAKWQTDPSAITRALGEKWEMLNVAMKPYPSCQCTHTSIDGILDQIKEHNIEVRDIDHIEIDVSSLILTTVCSPQVQKWNPQTVPECQFSLPYVVATAAYDNDVFLDSFSLESRKRQDVRELMKRVSVKEDPGLPPFGAKVSIRLKDGTQYSKTYIQIKGHPEKRFTEKELIEKFKKCVRFSAYRLSNEAVESVIETILNMERTGDVMSSLFDPLTPE
jgi:2-methylcitrate dehydratase PrpD